MPIYHKDHRAWLKVQEKLESASNNIYVRAGEIRWVSLGVNIGSEIDGKGVSFTRPCLLLHVIGDTLALVVPFTSQKKNNKQFYHNIKLNHFDSYVCLSQMRVVSQKRIFKRIIKIPKEQFFDIKRVIFNFYDKDSNKN